MIHISHVHEHPLALLIQDESTPAAEEGARCSACDGGVDRATPAYGCATATSSGCNKFYLHKRCAEELSPELVDHPLHPLHPLILLPNAPHSSCGEFQCNFCHGSFSGLVYRCDLCQFDLHVHCTLLQSFDDKPPLQHPAHGHALIFVSETHNKLRKNDSCSGCSKNLYAGGSVYRCMDCSDGFQLHKECAELALPPEIRLPLFHPPHPLTFTADKHSYYRSCEFCRRYCGEFVYNCQSCEFQLHFNCGLLLLQLDQSSNFPILERSPHQHPLIFIEKLSHTIKGDCVGCCKELSECSSIYRCFDCEFLCFHKECAELPLEIKHPLDRKHPLTLLQTPPLHPNTCSCSICRLKWKGFVYYCQYGCELGIIPEDASSLPVITAPSHEHPWFLLSRPISFVCDFCGMDGDRTPYLCTTCNLIVHRDCISLPNGNHGIRITRHHHPIFHSYFLPLENSECRICHKEVNTGFGSYRCCSAASNCNYIVHVKCATDKNVWDGTIVEAGDYDEEGESGNLITDVIQTMCVKGEEMAIEIKHAYHNHNLLLNNFDGVDVEDDNDYEDDDRISCDGCTRPISNTTPFYGCDEQSCRRFFLHKTCAELPPNMPHPSHKHSLSLMNNEELLLLSHILCSACQRFHHGFGYSCLECKFQIDIGCSSLSDTFMHASHQHPLFLIYDAQGNCSGCSKKFPVFSPESPSLGYICTHHDQGCNFILDFSCLTLPQIAQYKYDKHPLTLTYHDVSDPNQCFCDLCEEERDPNQWFYYCQDCNTTVHSKCILGILPFIKVGRTENYHCHPHPLTFVKKIWNCPPCNLCNKICYGQVLECKEAGCNFMVHWDCGVGTGSLTDPRDFLMMLVARLQQY